MCTRCVHPKQLGWLGQNVYYSDFRFRISLGVADFMLSPAYICVQASIVTDKSKKEYLILADWRQNQDTVRCWIRQIIAAFCE